MVVEGDHGENLTGRCSWVAGPAGALVELPEIGRIEVNTRPDRCREALSRARNRIFRGNHREIHGRAPGMGAGADIGQSVV